MAKKLYVGNLTYEVTSSALEQMFQPHGKVESAQVIMDRDTGYSKGFGFVEMGTQQEAQAAIQALNGQNANGRALTVNGVQGDGETSGDQPSCRSCASESCVTTPRPASTAGRVVLYGLPRPLRANGAFSPACGTRSAGGKVHSSWQLTPSAV